MWSSIPTRIPLKNFILIAYISSLLLVSHALVVNHLKDQNSISFIASPNHNFFRKYCHGVGEGFMQKNSNNHSTRSGIQMYFDDVSRNAKFTTGFSSPLSYHGNGDHLLQPIQEYSNSQRYAEEKMDALNQFLHKYDEESASKLSEEEVFSITRSWICKTKEMEMRLSKKDDMKKNNAVEMLMSDSTSLVGCIADFWKSVVQKMQVYEAKVNHDSSFFEENDYAIKLIYPHCADLYDFSMFSWMKTVIEYSSQSYRCVIGKQLQIVLYHPHFKNQPDIFGGYSQDHSPFPTLGLRFSPLSATEENLPYIGKWFSSMDTVTLDSIENLYNSRAATKATPFNGVDLTLYEEYTSGVGKDGLWNDRGIIKIFQEWAEIATGDQDQILLECSNESANIFTKSRLLQYNEITPFFVSRADIPEKAYFDTWTMISQFIDESKSAISTTTTETSSHMDDSKLISSFVIFTHYSNFNANDFKNFALTINAALKQMKFDERKLSMEIFHPEYVGKKESHSQIRRSPYPAIEIILSTSDEKI